MHAFTQANVAAARSRVAKCIAALKAAVLAPEGHATWEQIGIAMMHAHQAQAQLDDALRLETMAEEMEDVGT